MSEPYWIQAGGTPGVPGPPGPQGPQGPAGAAGSMWQTGDQKISAIAASHSDPAGGMWLLMDGSAIPGSYSALIALIGPNVPDARGRGLVMKGTHADVDQIGDNDGVALASRSPKHKSSVSDPTHGHPGAYNKMSSSNASDTTTLGPTLGTGGVAYAPTSVVIPGAATGVTVGPAASAMIDQGSYSVVGNLFIHT